MHSDEENTAHKIKVLHIKTPVGQFQASILASAATDATQRYVHCSLAVSIAYSLQDNIAPHRRDALWLSLKVSILQLYVLRNLEL